MYNPYINIVTVCFNAEKEIESTIKSVLCQSYSNIHYVVIDGASKDSTMTIIRKYSNKISVVISEPDKGIFDAMNKAVDFIKDGYVLFLNAGDSLFCKDTIKKGVDCGLEADFVGGIAKYSSFRYWIPVRQNVTLVDVIQGGAVNHQSVFVRSEIFRSEQYDINYQTIADDVYFIKKVVFENCSWKPIPLIISNYDVHGVSNDKKRYQTIMDERQKFYSRMLPEKVLQDYQIKRSFFQRYNPIRLLNRCVQNAQVYFLLDNCKY